MKKSILSILIYSFISLTLLYGDVGLSEVNKDNHKSIVGNTIKIEISQPDKDKKITISVAVTMSKGEKFIRADLHNKGDMKEELAIKPKTDMDNGNTKLEWIINQNLISKIVLDVLIDYEHGDATDLI